MDKIELKNSSTTSDCIKIWQYINSRESDCTFDEISDAMFGNLATSSDKAGVQRILRRLEEVGAIRIYQPKDNKGKWLNTTFAIIAEPVKKQPGHGKFKGVCKDCNKEFFKFIKSVHFDLCHECTEEKYMKSKNVKCSYCSLELPANKSRLYKTKYFHHECHEKNMEDLKRKKQDDIENKKIMCRKCGGNKLDIRARLCENCKKVPSAIVKNCKLCGNSFSGILCNNDACVAMEYCKKNVSFRGAYLNATDRGRSIKARIIGIRCEVCEYDKILQYHHVIFRENGGSDELTNIIALCPNHHQEVHHCGLDISEYHKKTLRRLEDIKNGIIEISL